MAYRTPGKVEPDRQKWVQVYPPTGKPGVRINLRQWRLPSPAPSRSRRYTLVEWMVGLAITAFVLALVLTLVTGDLPSSPCCSCSPQPCTCQCNDNLWGDE